MKASPSPQKVDNILVHPLTGWGAVWQHIAIRGNWNSDQTSRNINVLDLKVVQLALDHFGPALLNHHVLIRTENTSVVYHINHQGSTRSRRLLKLTWDLLIWAFPRLASIRAMYVPGVSNVVEDFLSHQRPLPGEWKLNPDVVQMIWHRFGRANVDLFASEESIHCPLWLSWTKKSSPLVQDALAHTWPDLLLYAFSPTPLILPNLHTIWRGHYKVLRVAPNWPGRPWFPLFIQKAVLLLTTDRCSWLAVRCEQRCPCCQRFPWALQSKRAYFLNMDGLRLFKDAVPSVSSWLQSLPVF